MKSTPEEDEFEPTENETRWESLKGESHARGLEFLLGGRRQRWRKEQQFLELSLTIRDLSG